MANTPRIDPARRVAEILFDGEVTNPEAVELFQILQQERVYLQNQTDDSWDFFQTGDVRNILLERVNTKLILWNSSYRLLAITVAKDKKDGKDSQDKTAFKDPIVPDGNYWVNIAFQIYKIYPDCASVYFVELVSDRVAPSGQDLTFRKENTGPCGD